MTWVVGEPQGRDQWLMDVSIHTGLDYLTYIFCALKPRFHHKVYPLSGLDCYNYSPIQWMDHKPTEVFRNPLQDIPSC